jgi:hypothetical protein
MTDVTRALNLPDRCCVFYGVSPMPHAPQRPAPPDDGSGEIAFPIFVGSDGSVFLIAGCSGTLTECYAEQPDGGATLREAIASVGGRVDG